jgi:hypothetical protein
MSQRWPMTTVSIQDGAESFQVALFETLPAQTEFLQQSLAGRAIDLHVLHVVDGADHFSFMNVRPPQTVEPLPDREAFLADLATEVTRFVRSGEGR